MVTQKCLTISSSIKITPGTFLPAAGVICVPSSFVAPRLCPDGETDETYSFSTIEGTIVQEFCIPGICNQGTVWKYTFCFDGSLITEGQTITAEDVTGIFAKGCVGTWIDDKVGNEVTLVDNGDGTLTFTSQHGCSTTFFNGEGPLVTIHYLNNNLQATGQAVSTGPTTLVNFYITNNAATVLYVKLYDQVNIPNPGTDIPVKELLIPATGFGATGSPNWTFVTKCWVRATVGVGYTDNTDPGANEIIVNFELT